MYVQSSPHFRHPTGGDHHGQHLWVRAHAHPRRLPSTDDDSTYTPLPHDHRKSAGPDRGTARAVGRADDGRATDLARASSTFGRPVATLYPASTRSIHEVRESDASIFFFTRAFASIARANATSRLGLETARMDGWMNEWVDIISSRSRGTQRPDGWDG